MNRIRFGVAAAVAAVALVVTAPAGAATRLVATVGPDFTITLTLNGKKVRTLKAGMYTIAVRDRSDEHNFHLRGLGVNKTTGVERVGNATWTLRLRKGTYRYICDPHADHMKGSFTVR